MKIAIVGAGPIGCYTARLLKSCGFAPLVIEEHREIGRPVHCAGVVGGETFRNKALPISRRAIRNRIDGAIIRYGNKSLQIKREGVAFVIDREVFDKELGKGLDVKYETRFLGFEKNKNGYLIETDKGEIQADILIGADGARSQVREATNLKASIRYKSGVQFRLRCKLEHDNLVEVHIKKPFFSWIIPEGDRMVRAGIISDNPYHDLTEFLRERKIGGKILEKFGGLVPMGGCHTVDGGVALVGDAACQVKPLTHGGIYYGMKSAEILVQCITSGKLSSYDRRWKKKFGNEIRISSKAKEIYERLCDRDLEQIFDLVKENSRIIEKLANFENHSSIILEIMKNPKTQKRIGGVLWNLLKGSLLR